LASPKTATHPRECGGTAAAANRIKVNKGLSPRVRGNLCQPADRAAAAGPIPASAGEPSPALAGIGPD
jgi:hypothetical protein